MLFFQAAFATFLATSVSAYGYGKSAGGYSAGNGYGSNSDSNTAGGFSSLAASGNGGYSSAKSFGDIPIAIVSRQKFDVREVASQAPGEPIAVYVDSVSAPFKMIFRSRSGEMNIQQQHIPGPGSTQESQSEDEPHRLIHTITKPIIQEVREIITPFRLIRQDVQPVQEEIETTVARSSNNKLPDASTVPVANDDGKDFSGYSSSNNKQNAPDNDGDNFKDVSVAGNGANNYGTATNVERKQGFTQVRSQPAAYSGRMIRTQSGGYRRA